MPTKKSSVIVTTFNEEATISRLLDALIHQTLPPTEVIIVDAESTDHTADCLSSYQQAKLPFKLQLISEPGNISHGRNTALEAASCELIAITDAGCIPHPEWLEQLVLTQQTTNAPVVAGYYQGLADTPFEEAVVPYVLVMPDQVNPNDFLPATRSMLLEKKVWEQLGGFDETLTVSEDYAFAQLVRKAHIPIAFTSEAVVGWLPRSNLVAFARMIFAFAQGDIRAGIVRRRVVGVFGRYIPGLLLVTGALITGWLWLWWLIGASVLGYLTWSVLKNNRYVPTGWYWLPILQLTADLMVMTGTLHGILLRFL